jgi:carboxymethylenebutenolidase
MIQRQIDIATRDGDMTTFIVHPEREGPHPVVLFFMDAPGFRGELRDMARRLATSGYYVMLPNLYYRSNVLELGPLPVDPEAPERKRMSELMGSISIDLVMRDAETLLTFAAADPAADASRAGTVGYCMSGRYAINAVGRFEGVVKAGASYYGTHLVTDKPNSPHRVAQATKGETYFACAEIDHWAPLEMVEALKAALADVPRAEVELYPGVEHGFAFPKRYCFNRDAAETHWERLIALLRRTVG